MRRHTAFPRPGDRIRLAIPHPSDTSEPQARYGTVLERSCGRSNALRVRWDRPGDSAPLATDAGAESWLADAGWHWDKAHLEVVDAHAAVQTPLVPTERRAPASEEERWLAATPAGAPSGGVNGSLDAVAEWEAALASEIHATGDSSWEELLASALDHGAPVAKPRGVAPSRADAVRRPTAPSAPPAPPAVAAPAPDLSGWAPQPASAHKDVRRSTPAESRVEEEPEVEQAPASAPLKAWTGDDILPPPRAGGKRWGRR